MKGEFGRRVVEALSGTAEQAQCREPGPTMPERLGSQRCRAGLVAPDFVRHHLTGDLCRRLALEEDGRSSYDSDPPTRSGRFQIGPSRGHRLEARFRRSRLRRGTGGRRRRSFRTGAIRHSGQGVLGRQADAAPASGGPCLHGHLRCLLRRFEKPVRRRTAAGLPARRRHCATRLYVAGVTWIVGEGSDGTGDERTPAANCR